MRPADPLYQRFRNPGHKAWVPFFGAFGTAWDDAMVARWSANPLDVLWLEMVAAGGAAG